MQKSEVVEKIKKMVEDLTIINKDLNDKAIESAINNLKIFISSGKKIGREEYYHSLMREMILNILGNKLGCYVESKSLNFVKLGFRPDIVLISEKEIIIIEIETDKRRTLKKMNKIYKSLENIYSLPITTNRKIKVIFCLAEEWKEVINIAKKYNFFVYVLENNKLKKVIDYD